MPGLYSASALDQLLAVDLHDKIKSMGNILTNNVDRAIYNYVSKCRSSGLFEPLSPSGMFRKLQYTNKDTNKK